MLLWTHSFLITINLGTIRCFLYFLFSSLQQCLSYPHIAAQDVTCYKWKSISIQLNHLNICYLYVWCLLDGSVGSNVINSINFDKFYLVHTKSHNRAFTDLHSFNTSSSANNSSIVGPPSLSSRSAILVDLLPEAFIKSL